MLVANPALLEFGFLTKGVPADGQVMVIDTGDAPYVFQGFNFPNPPITSMDAKIKHGLSLTPIAVGDTVHPGDTIILGIHFLLDTYTDTTVSYSLLTDHTLCT